MTKTGTPRESIVSKLNNSKDYPTFFLGKEEICWVVKDWLETHSKQYAYVDLDFTWNLPVMEVEIDNMPVTQT